MVKAFTLLWLKLSATMLAAVSRYILFPLNRFDGLQGDVTRTIRTEVPLQTVTSPSHIHPVQRTF
jgi:hypothetical protein